MGVGVAGRLREAGSLAGQPAGPASARRSVASGSWAGATGSVYVGTPEDGPGTRTGDQRRARRTVRITDPQRVARARETLDTLHRGR